VTDTPRPGGATYAAAGVDIEAGDRAVELMKQWVAKATRPEVVGGLGGFAGLFDASKLTAYRRPLLATSTDGVGTKVAIAQRLDVHHTIGFDLVGMVVDDLVVCGAEPLFMTDYIATGKVVPERIAAIVRGIAQACVQAGCALVGGETAEHPGLLAADEYDVAGAATGVVEADALLGPERIAAGDAVVALASSGLHSNGYSLVRHVLLGQAGWSLDRPVAEFGRTLGEELLEPTRIYALTCLELARRVEVHAYAHITGGGLAANLARVIPAGLHARLERSSWRPAPVFEVVGAVGRIARGELERTLNMGVGMAAVLPAQAADAAIAALRDLGLSAWLLGTIEQADDAGAPGTAELTGDHAA
jgi:phosphoribosylformylglycinamidine cyclo-ligase